MCNPRFEGFLLGGFSPTSMISTLLVSCNDRIGNKLCTERAYRRPTAASALLLVTAAKACDGAMVLRGHPGGDH